MMVFMLTVMSWWSRMIISQLVAPCCLLLFDSLLIMASLSHLAVEWNLIGIRTQLPFDDGNRPQTAEEEEPAEYLRFQSVFRFKET